MMHRSALVALMLTLGSCVSAPRAPAPPTPAPLPTVAPSPAPVPSTDWTEWPRAPGNWTYRTDNGAPRALFGPSGAGAQLMLVCSGSPRRILIVRPSTATSGTMVVDTTFGQERLSGGTSPATPGAFAAGRAATDPLFDRIAFSRGRFAVRVDGAPPIAVPTWSEVGRLIEDCRSPAP